MIKSELIQKIAGEPASVPAGRGAHRQHDLRRQIIEAMAQGSRVELRGFGAFSVKARRPAGRNPRTGDAVVVEEKHVPFFKTGKLLRDRLNDGWIAAEPRADMRIIRLILLCLFSR